MTQELKTYFLNALGYDDCREIETVQELWSGYGKIIKSELIGDRQSQKVILKYICPPAEKNHPRNWNTDLSHQRKLKSYEVEQIWYETYSHKHDMLSRLPKLYGRFSSGTERLLVLEDLDEAGYPLRKSTLSVTDCELCLSWLANFHALYLHADTAGLWETGSYWHLDTRPDEWKAMPEGALKEAAIKLDRLLKTCRYQTIIHGDAKLANFCFDVNMTKVAAVDFQYVGGGCGMKDVVYFLGSALSGEECEQYESRLLDYYMNALQAALKENRQVDFAHLESEWRQMYDIAWTDFTRFLKGWMPGHHKLNGYSGKVMQRALDQLA